VAPKQRDTSAIICKAIDMQQSSPAQREPMPADADTSTRRRILAATSEVLSRNGMAKLSLSEVALQAGVSRPTLYRWFASKEELIDAFGVYERQLYDRGMGNATAGLYGTAKLDAALRFIVEYQQSYSGVRMVDIEPGRVIGQLSQVIPIMRERLQRLLPGPGGAVAAATAIRVAVSHYLVRSDDADQFLAQLRHAVGITHPTAASGEPSAAPSEAAETSFTVHFHGRRPESFADDHSWTTIGGGALEITREHGEKVVYSPSYWTSVETGAPRHRHR
jgi:AcrR family transcriptional regulator